MKSQFELHRYQLEVLSITTAVLFLTFLAFAHSTVASSVIHIMLVK